MIGMGVGLIEEEWLEETTPPPTDGALLTEDGGYLLQEDGGKILLEGE